MPVASMLTLAGACLAAAPVQAHGAPRAHTEPKVRVSPQDAAATRAYLQADYAYVQANVVNLPVARAAVEGLAGRIGVECPGVLKGAPSAFGLSVSGSESPPSARRFAELRREEGQASTLYDELGSALGLAVTQADRQAALVFAGAVTPLSWSDPTVASLVHERIAELQEKLGQALPDVCADMRAWVASGYRALSPATKEFRAKQEARQAAVVTVVHGQVVPASRPTLGELLARYENASDRALIARAQRLALSELSRLRPLASVGERLGRALGAAPRPGAKVHEEESKSPGVTIARGKTAAGERFVARLRRNRPRSPVFKEDRCRLSLSIESGQRQDGVNFSSNSEETCMSRTGRPAFPSVDCNSGELTVTLNTLPATRSVRLRLSNGRTIASPVIFVPPRLGGPAGYYYQVVRGPSPIPVALTELDAHGRALRTVVLPHIVECTEHPVKYFPGGIRTLVQEAAPNGGPPFAIVAERYRFLGKVYFELKLNVERSGEGGNEGGGRIILSPPPRALEWKIEEGCKPHPYAILYSLLKQPGDTVLSRTGATLTPWRTVPIPAYLHAGGALVYTVLSEPPEELIVRAPDGHTVASEKLAPFATEARETCEGEAEG